MITRLLVLLSSLVAFAGCSWDEPTLWTTSFAPYVWIPSESPLWGQVRPGDPVRLLKAHGVSRGRDLYDASKNHKNDPVIPSGSVLVIKEVMFFKLPVESRRYHVTLEMDGFRYTLDLESRYPGQIFDAKALKEAGVAIPGR